MILVKSPVICLFALLVALIIALSFPSDAQSILVTGRVADPQGRVVPKASVELLDADQRQLLGHATTASDGVFRIDVAAPGKFILKITADGFRPVEREIVAVQNGSSDIAIRMSQLATRNENVSVTVDVNETDVLSPDPAEKVFVRQDLLDANPGRPGAPVSIPGYPIETASSGIKAPQYFAPGVAGDHGEPIAQYISVGSFLLPNNLSANAHGNGYADPNILIPEIIESVKVDGGAYDVREGNHSVNLAATYGLRSRLDPFVTITGDYRDIDVVTGFSPSPDSWMAFSASYGNGFLDRLEHRQQYKFIGERVFRTDQHKITAFGIGYFGRSHVPGLVPIFGFNPVDNYKNYGDTVDPRQKDQTHTALAAVNDVWQISGNQQLQLSGFFRTYNLALYSDFGQGLIRQSEFRTVGGGSADYVNKISEYFSLLGGFDYEREAPRRDDLDHYNFFDSANPGYYGPFTKVDGNNVTIASYTPYAAAKGGLGHYFRYYVGWRRDQINVDNEDLINSDDSFQKWVGVNSPKATVSFLPKEAWYAPLISLSYGESFFTEDPRIGIGGMGATAGTLVARSHSFQLVASKKVAQTDVRLTLGHVTSSAELAKIDPDTGLQIDQGPSRLRFMTVTLRRNFSQGSLLATFSKADARDLDSGQPTPEAPRSLFDLLGTIQKLPFRLQARGEFEFIGTKPLGTGCAPDLTAECTGVPVKEFRGAVVRPFKHDRVTAGVNFLIASGYTGQTTQNFYPSDIQEVVGVRIPSYASVSVTYRFGKSVTP